MWHDPGGDWACATRRNRALQLLSPSTSALSRWTEWGWGSSFPPAQCKPLRAGVAGRRAWVSALDGYPPRGCRRAGAQCGQGRRRERPARAAALARPLQASSRYNRTVWILNQLLESQRGCAAQIATGRRARESKGQLFAFQYCRNRCLADSVMRLKECNVSGLSPYAESQSECMSRRSGSAGSARRRRSSRSASQPSALAAGKPTPPGSSESIKRRTASISRLGQTRRTFQNKGGPWMMPVRSVLYAVGWKNRPSGT